MVANTADHSRFALSDLLVWLRFDKGEVTELGLY